MKFYKKILSIFLIGLIIQGVVSAIDITRVFGQSLTITLRPRISTGTGSTWLGPYAADLNNDGFMEIVNAGDNGLAALDPTTGNVIWFIPGAFGHNPIEMIDLNKDGILEILLCPETKGVMAIHGNNGSIYWYNQNAAGKGTYLTVGDINADGYPEIFSAYPGAVTALTYDGRIFARTSTYYPCYGGVSLGDTNFDGTFEVYLGERSESYPSYPSGGRGLRAFWADNLTEIWAHPDILCSSQAPAMADVDNDGDLEIIVLHQTGGRGVAVINTDGSVNTYKGVYRKQLNLNLYAHDNPPIADLDGDGNLELITCSNANHDPTQPKIWDLVDWKLDATLPFPCMHPPGLADVDGDGSWEILDCNPKNITIFKYNPPKNDYDVIWTIPIANAHSFFIAQDIDNDGKLELVFNQHNGWVYICDLEAAAPTPLPRSGESFYSQYRTRVPVYVPPSDQSPRIAEFSPADEATNVPVTLSGLSFKLIDYQNELMSYTVTTSPNIGSASDINVPNGKITVPVSGLSPSTTYTCTVTATDGKYTTKRTFTFYTEGTASLTISTTPIGTGSVIKNPDKATYAYGERVQLTAVATEPLAYKFSKWGGDLAWMGSNNPATIIMVGNKVVTAVFTKIQYTLTISTTGSGSVTRNNTGPYYYGDAVELTAIPAFGWLFSHWELDLTESQNPATIVINSNKRVKAVFTEVIPPTQYQLTISVSGSGVTTPAVGSYMYDEGTVVSATAVPDSAWTFDHWALDTVNVGSSNPLSVKMNSNHALEAVFTPEQYILTINVSPEGSGTFTLNNTGPYYYGDAVQLTAEPNTGWYFSRWEEEGEVLGNQDTITIIMDGDKTITAVFTQEISQWWSPNWQYRRIITIDPAKVAGELTDFPVLIEITDSSFSEKAQPDGDDFVFTDADNMKLDHQIELYNSTTGHLIAWVKVHHLSSITDTLIYMYYGNKNCENQQNPTGVWDENYKVVMHLNEETGTQYDSTVNGNNGTPYGSLVQSAPGYIGNCVEFNGGYIQLPQVFTTETQFTFSAWIYPRSGARYFISQYRSPYQGAFLQVYGNNRIELYVNNIIVAKSIVINTWYYVVATFDGTTARLYVNEGSPTFALASPPIWPSGTMYIGDRYYHDRKFYGFIDEVRASNIARNQAWILTEYNNQLNPSQFFSLGPEEAAF
ncbi:MAG: DUF2341 domain-containing protein [Candidatus Bathyarchaeales archaeon]